MKFEIISKPSYSLLDLRLNVGEEVLAETGAMIYMRGVKLKTEAKGGFLGGLKRILAGESFFVNRFVAVESDAVLGLAPPYQGDIIHIPLNGVVYAQSGAFLASTPNVEIDAKWSGARGFFAGEGLILLKIRGSGDLFLSSFGGIVEMHVKDRFVVDTGHIVAFEDGLDFSVKRVGGLKATLLSGEGLVAEFRGDGKLWIQTRSIGDFVGWLSSLLPKRD